MPGWIGHSCPMPLTLILISLAGLAQMGPRNPVEAALQRRVKRKKKVASATQVRFFSTTVIPTGAQCQRRRSGEGPAVLYIVCEPARNPGGTLPWNPTLRKEREGWAPGYPATM